jgi:hypothetical protein
MMQLKKVFLLQFVLLVVTLFLVSSGFSQGKKEGVFSFFGSIDSIPESRRFIVVNEQRVYVTSNTKIVDENNNQLKMNQPLISHSTLRSTKPKPSSGIRMTTGYMERRRQPHRAGFDLQGTLLYFGIFNP